MSLSHIIRLTAKQVLDRVGRTENEYQRLLKTDTEKYQELVESYKTGNPKVDKAIYLGKVKGKSYITEGNHSIHAAITAGYKGLFAVLIRKFKTLEDIAEQILLLNHNTPFPTSKKFALNLLLKCIAKKLASRLIAAHLFKKCSDEKEGANNSITYLTVAEMYQAFVEQNPNPQRRKMGKILITNSQKNTIWHFTEHMANLAEIKNLVNDKKKVNDICIMIGWASLGYRGQCQKLITKTAKNFESDCLTMKKVHRSIQKKAGWKSTFAQYCV